MNNLRTSVTYTASVKFSSAKVCFVYVPETWLTESMDIHIFKLLYGEKKEAYVTVLPYKLINHLRPDILINGKFAEKLNLSEKESVCLQPLLRSVPAAQEITLEPLTADDWEMLELNAESIERNLMNQIRVIWRNQVFPVWVNNSSLYVKVAHTHPFVQPVLLVEFSEVHVAPKGRYTMGEMSPKNPDSEKVEKKTPNHLQFRHLRRHSKNKDSLSPQRVKLNSPEWSNNSGSISQNITPVSFAYSLISSFFPVTLQEKSPYLDDSYKDFEPWNLDLLLRVVPYTRSHKRLPSIVQATTVFISASTYVDIYGAEDIPLCFVGVLQKFPLPESARKSGNGSGHKMSKEPKSNHLTDSASKARNRSKEDRTANGTAQSDERQATFNSVCVTVMVVQSSDADEFGLPLCLFYSKNIIIVPKDLKRCLNLEVSSIVHLKGVQSPPIALTSVVIHPISQLPKRVSNEIIFTNFHKWAFGNDRQDSSFVLSDGTLLSLRLFGEKHEFFINLKEVADQTINSSSLSLSSISPNSSDSDLKNNRIDPKYGYVNTVNIKDIQISAGNLMCLSILVDRPYLHKPDGLYQEIPAVQLDALGGVTQLAEEALQSLEFWLKLRPISYLSNHPFTFFGCMLICGPKGVGKSALANALCRKLAKSPYHVFVKVVHCLPLKGKRVDTIAKKWDDIASEAVHRQSSIILFEDLDYIASCPTSHEQEVGPDGVYFANIVQAFIHMMKKLKECDSKVAVIVTSQSTHSLHPNLINAKGRHVFSSVIEVQPPNVEQRKEILSSLAYSKPHISSRTIETVDWKKIANKTEGFVAQDLDSLVDRATHAAWVRMANSPKVSEIMLNLEDFEMALEGYVPSSLRGIPLQVHDHKTWNDVGGLAEIKKTIQQIILWPVKYKQIFKSYSLKPQTNILLYGAPGTGKTLLAGVIANECGLNFISIKGPELLSKYIGASEQAIRDLFKRASAARPCILFFDEFDSIAPRRGHDSTGVTDRVVNQLLTQLDGVESLEGVHVIAASSRPELIDPALVRPGRLDKCLLCPLPNENERLDILHCLSTKLPLGIDVDLEYVAARTEHFSGADLQALLYTANIEALHSAQENSTRKYSATSDDITYSIASDKILYMPTIEEGLNVPNYEDGKKIVQEIAVIKENFCGVVERRGSNRRSTLSIMINQDHLIKVVDDMKPSVSPQERLRYERIFNNFQNGRNEGELSSSLTETMKRVTLA